MSKTNNENKENKDNKDSMDNKEIPSYMTLSIKDMSGKIYSIFVDSNTTVNSLKRIVLGQIRIFNENPTLLFDGKKFNDNNTLNECNINSSTKIHIVSRVSSFF
jgi:hypothetical protein